MPSLIRKSGVKGWTALANTKVDQRVGSLISVLAPGTGPMPGNVPKAPRLNSNFDSESRAPEMPKMLSAGKRLVRAASVVSTAFSTSSVAVFRGRLFCMARSTACSRVRTGAVAAAFVFFHHAGGGGTHRRQPIPQDKDVRRSLAKR